MKVQEDCVWNKSCLTGSKWLNLNALSTDVTESHPITVKMSIIVCPTKRARLGKPRLQINDGTKQAQQSANGPFRMPQFSTYDFGQEAKHALLSFQFKEKLIISAYYKITQGILGQSQVSIIRHTFYKQRLVQTSPHTYVTLRHPNITLFSKKMSNYTFLALSKNQF